jgi:biotin transport system substrate-specific component
LKVSVIALHFLAAPVYRRFNLVGRGFPMSAVAVSRPLVGSFIPAEGAGRVVALAGFAILGTLILWASAKISVPFWPVPMTLQTGAVVLIGAAYGARLGFATVVLYLLEGASGLPVFSSGGGPAYLLGPTGGFLIGFAFAAYIVGWLVERGFDRSPLTLFGAMLAGDAVIFLLGFIWLAWFATLSTGAIGVGPAAAFTGGVLKFVLGDLLKMALAAALVSAGARLVRR